MAPTILARVPGAPVEIDQTTDTLTLTGADLQATVEPVLGQLKGDYSSLLIGPLDRACFSVGNTSINNSFSFVPLKVEQHGKCVPTRITPTARSHDLSDTDQGVY